MKIRFAVVCSLLLLAAAPTFAACSACTGSVAPYCEANPDGGTRCRFGIDTCTTVSAPLCTGFAEQDALPAVLADWTVASIEISRPDAEKAVVTAPAAVAQADVAQPAPQK